MAATELPEGSKRVLMDCFKKFDRSGNGVLEVKELPEALRFAGIFVTKEGAAELAQLLDTNKDGKVQISEMVNNWKALSQHSVNGDELLDAFKTIDKNKDGYIRVPELKAVLTKAGEQWKLNEAKACIENLMKFDKDGDGKFSYPEFVEMYTHNMFPFKKPDVVPKKDITQDYEQFKDEEEEEEKAKDAVDGKRAEDEKTEETAESETPAESAEGTKSADVAACDTKEDKSGSESGA